MTIQSFNNQLFGVHIWLDLSPEKYPINPKNRLNWETKHLETQDEEDITRYGATYLHLFFLIFWTTDMFSFSLWQARSSMPVNIPSMCCAVPWFQRVRVCLFFCQSLGSPGSSGLGRLQPLGSAPGRTAESAYRSAQLGMKAPNLLLNVMIKKKKKNLDFGKS